MPFGTITLNDGHKIPQIGYGTWKIPRNVTSKQVDQALEVGFDHLDTAQIYQNEPEVGQAFKESGLARSDVFITTKWSGLKSPRESLNDSLEYLGVSYVDLYLIHHPRITGGDIEGTWKQFEEFVKLGLAKSIGVSNFSEEDLDELLSTATIKPVVNQIKLEPYGIATTQPLLDFHARHNIVTEGYSILTPLTTNPGGPVDKPVNEIATRLGIQPEQVLLAWGKAKGAVLVTSSSRKDRLERYLKVGDIDLTEDDVKEIDAAGTKGAKRAQIIDRAKAAAKVVCWIVLVAYGFNNLWRE